MLITLVNVDSGLRDAWLKGYVYFNYHCNVADGGTVDCKRVTDFRKVVLK